MGGAPVHPTASRATPYPIPPSAPATELPNLATLKGTEGSTFTLTAVRRVSAKLVSVEGVLHHKTAPRGLAESGFSYVQKRGEDEPRFTNEFSIVTLAVPGDPRVYLPARTADGDCACSRVRNPGLEPYAVYVYVSAPEQAPRVTVRVEGYGTVPNVEVTS